MELRKIVRVIATVIAICTMASAGSLIFITTYLHRLTTQIDANLESVRAAEEIELQLLWHARNTNRATLMDAPELAADAAQAHATVLAWLETARLYVGSADEARILARLEQELQVYFAKQAELAMAGLPALDRYVEAVALFDDAYAQAEELLRINVAQASTATAQAAAWDRIATWIGFSVAITLLVGMALVAISARSAIYRPLLALGDAMRRYAARDYKSRAEVQGPHEIRAIARAFNEMAEDLERHRSQQMVFVASVAHELRNPLAALKAAIDVLAAGGGSARGHLTSVVSRQIDALVRLVSDLIDAAHVESGELALNCAEHDLRDVVIDAVTLFRGVAPHHEFVTKVPETLSEVACDRARIDQVVNNLLSNAIKYSPQGGRIEARVCARDNGVSIEIADQGIGIAPEDRAALFEPFRRGKRVSGAIRGTGIGLSVARRIVELHGGHISVESTVGQGSTFSFWLPNEQSNGSAACRPPTEVLPAHVVRQSTETERLRIPSREH
jgi:signal transduction histidine kinase